MVSIYSYFTLSILQFLIYSGHIYQYYLVNGDCTILLDFHISLNKHVLYHILDNIWRNILIFCSFSDKRSQPLRHLTFENNQTMYPNWREKVKEIVDEIGTERVWQFLIRTCGYKLITLILLCNSKDIGISNLRRYLTIDEFVKYVTGMNKLPKIFVYYNGFRIHLSFTTLIGHTPNEVQFEEIHTELCGAIVRNPNNRLSMLFALSDVHIGNVIIKRTNTTESGDMNFFDQILRTFPLVNKTKSVPKNTQSTKEESLPPKIVCKVYHDLHKFMEQIVTRRIPAARVNGRRILVAKRRLQFIKK